MKGECLMESLALDVKWSRMQWALLDIFVCGRFSKRNLLQWDGSGWSHTGRHEYTPQWKG